MSYRFPRTSCEDGGKFWLLQDTSWVWDLGLIHKMGKLGKAKQSALCTLDSTDLTEGF